MHSNGKNNSQNAKGKWKRMVGIEMKAESFFLGCSMVLYILLCGIKARLLSKERKWKLQTWKCFRNHSWIDW